MVIFSNSPFDKEIRIDCDMIKMNTKKYGEICLLNNYRNSIFEISDCDIIFKTKDGDKKIKLNGNGIVEVKNNNVSCFGDFEKISL